MGRRRPPNPRGGAPQTYANYARDRLVAVQDPRGLVTSYTFNALGDQTQLTSPDTGTTQYSYNTAGNLAVRTDALSQTTSYGYDALGRMINQVVTNGPTFTYSYDQGAFGVGRLGAISEGSAGITQYSYDAFGRVTAKSQNLHGRTLTVGYGYAPGGKLNRITYPSGRLLSYGFDAAGRIERLSLDGVVLLEQAGWQPFGPPDGWSWGNGAIHQRNYDRDGRMKTLVLPSLPAEQQTFGYDNLNRLTAANAAASNLNLGYAYDATGNRIQVTQNGATNQYTTAATSNRLLGIAGNAPRQFSYNANGSIVNDTGNSLVFDGGELLVSVGASTHHSDTGHVRRRGIDAGIAHFEATRSATQPLPGSPARIGGDVPHQLLTAKHSRWHAPAVRQRELMIGMRMVDCRAAKLDYFQTGRGFQYAMTYQRRLQHTVARPHHERIALVLIDHFHPA